VRARACGVCVWVYVCVVRVGAVWWCGARLPNRMEVWLGRATPAGGAAAGPAGSSEGMDRSGRGKTPGARWRQKRV
jgi:hypothetical protein